MKIAVMGAGAVGCYYGGMLARAGHEVTLIGRAQHVDAVRRDGLFLETQTFQSQVRMDASTEASAVAGAKLVLFCVKSADTESTATDMAPHLELDALVLSLQNGVDNAERIQVDAAAGGGTSRGLRRKRNGWPRPRQAPRPRRVGHRPVAAQR